MIDLAVAANFARELTEEQFAPSQEHFSPREKRGASRRRSGHVPQAPGRETLRAQLPARADRPETTTRAPSGTRPDRSRLATAPIVRVLSRLVQVR